MYNQHVQIEFMAELTPEQYETVLKYMEATSQEDYDNAVRILRNHQFNLSMAINSRYTGNYDSFQSQPLRQNNRQPVDQVRPNNEQQVRQYLEYLRQKQNRSTLLDINLKIVPEFIKRKFMRSEFYNEYVDYLPVKLEDSGLRKILRNNKMGRKPIMFILGSKLQKYDCFIHFMSEEKIARKIAESFIVTGFNLNENNLHGQSSQYAPLKEDQLALPPSILILRQNLFQQPQIVYKFSNQAEIMSISVETLNLVLRAHQFQNRKDKNTLIKYRNYIRHQYYRGTPGYYEEQLDLDDDGLGSFSHQNMPGESSIIRSQTTNHSSMIREQNQQYEKMMKQTQEKKRKEMEEMKKLEQIAEQRKIRKMSLPDEPIEGQNIVRINFRCPDGTMLTRNFHDNEKVDILYHWVETNEDIQFEDNLKRQFQLMYSFPPVSLCDVREKQLKDVFESDQEKLMIREL